MRVTMKSETILRRRAERRASDLLRRREQIRRFLEIAAREGATDYGRLHLELAELAREAFAADYPDEITDVCGKCGREYGDLTATERAGFAVACPSDDCPGRYQLGAR